MSSNKCTESIFCKVLCPVFALIINFMPTPIFGSGIAGTSSNPQDEAAPLNAPDPEDVAFERSQNVQPDRINKSLVWNFFTKHPIRKGYAICKSCQAAGKEEGDCVYSAGGENKSNRGTSSLMKHMKRKHLTEWTTAERLQREEDERDRIAMNASTLRTYFGADRSASGSGPPHQKR